MRNSLVLLFLISSSMSFGMHRMLLMRVPKTHTIATFKVNTIRGVRTAFTPPEFYSRRERDDQLNTVRKDYENKESALIDKLGIINKERGKNYLARSYVN